MVAEHITVVIDGALPLTVVVGVANVVAVGITISVVASKAFAVKVRHRQRASRVANTITQCTIFLPERNVEAIVRVAEEIRIGVVGRVLQTTVHGITDEIAVPVVLAFAFARIDGVTNTVRVCVAIPAVALVVVALEVETMAWVG